MENNRQVVVYVVDDRPIDILICSLLLQKFDDTLIIETFENAQLALDQLRYQALNAPLDLPDYILLDLDMPRLDGWQFLEEYNQSKVQEVKDIQIYILSSSLYREDLRKAFIHPFVREFVGKPLNMDKIKTIFQKDDVEA